MCEGKCWHDPHPPDLPKPIWKLVDWECCENCGDDVECFTQAGGKIVYDGDEIICLGCGLVGQMNADGEDAWACWDEEDRPLAAREK